LPGGRAAAEALYVHVPFCTRKCGYCDFYSLAAAEDLQEDYLRALERELALLGPRLARPPQTVFIGGGTPTALGPQRLRRLLETVGEVAGGAREFTVEANPGTLDAGVGRILASCGVNRLSLGVQSFRERELATLGRRHRHAQVVSAVRAARQAGIERLSADLIFGIPAQSPASWRESLERTLDLGLEHISCYCLGFEDGTDLAARRDRGEVREMSEAGQQRLYFSAIEQLREAGWEHYEISNFCRPGCRCLHNLTYWRNLPYLGAGPAAASYLDGVRWSHPADLDAWAGPLLAGRGPQVRWERLGGAAAAAEALMLGLRLIEGVDCAAFGRRYGQAPEEFFPLSIGRHVRMANLIMHAGRLRVAPERLFLSDAIFSDLLAEAPPGDRQEGRSPLGERLGFSNTG
jgi:oxygen-independent coproporphyrinogen-3 oxidase